MQPLAGYNPRSQLQIEAQESLLRRDTEHSIAGSDGEHFSRAAQAVWMGTGTYLLVKIRVEPIFMLEMPVGWRNDR
ncbi:hypothetical protein V6Z94_010201 [Aspergillus fumigatus]